MLQNYPDRVTMIRERLTEALAPEDIDVEDVSHEHAGHEGAKSGGGHFNLLIVSDAFNGQSPIKRHRMVYDALGDAMKQEIHALSISCLHPRRILGATRFTSSHPFATRTKLCRLPPSS